MPLSKLSIGSIKKSVKGLTCPFSWLTRSSWPPWSLPGALHHSRPVCSPWLKVNCMISVKIMLHCNITNVSLCSATTGLSLLLMPRHLAVFGLWFVSSETEDPRYFADKGRWLLSSEGWRAVFGLWLSTVVDILLRWRLRRIWHLSFIRIPIDRLWSIYYSIGVVFQFLNWFLSFIKHHIMTQIRQK